MSIRSHNQFGAPGVSPWQVKNVFNHGRSRNHSLLDVVVFQHHEALVLREVSNKEPWPLWDRSWWDRKERPVSLQTLGQCSDPWPWGLHFCLFLNGASRCRIPGSKRHRTSPTPFGPMEWLYQNLDIWWLHCSNHLTAASGFYVTRLGWWDVSSSSSSSIGSTWFNSEAAYN